MTNSLLSRTSIAIALIGTLLLAGSMTIGVKKASAYHCGGWRGGCGYGGYGYRYPYYGGYGYGYPYYGGGYGYGYGYPYYYVYPSYSYYYPYYYPYYGGYGGLYGGYYGRPDYGLPGYGR